MDTFPTEGASGTICTALAGSHFPPAMNHSTASPTELLSIHQAPPHPDKRNKKHFKATLPAVPTLFHLSNAYKTTEEGQMPLRGATAHLLPASAPLKTMLFLLKKEYTIYLSHILSGDAATLSREAQTRPYTLVSITYRRASNLQKDFPLRVRLPEREDESSWNDAEEINTNQLSV